MADAENIYRPAMTYAELIERLQQLTDEQRQQSIRYIGERHTGRIDGLWVLEEDHVDAGEGLEPLSSYQDEPEDERPEVAEPAGAVFLNCID